MNYPFTRHAQVALYEALRPRLPQLVVLIAAVLMHPSHLREDFAQDLDPKLVATLSAQQQPADFSIIITPSGPVAWHAFPSWYAISAPTG
jgi:hypothetical protein